MPDALDEAIEILDRQSCKLLSPEGDSFVTHRPLMEDASVATFGASLHWPKSLGRDSVVYCVWCLKTVTAQR